MKKHITQREIDVAVMIKTAMDRALKRARTEQRSIAVRVTKSGNYYDVPTTDALRQGDREVATYHCDGRKDTVVVPKEKPDAARLMRTCQVALACLQAAREGCMVLPEYLTMIETVIREEGGEPFKEGIQ